MVRAGLSDRDDDVDAKLDAAIAGLNYDPLIYWQRTTLTGFGSTEPDVT